MNLTRIYILIIRYKRDQTVPLARVVAQYQNELPIPFKRYQIQNVWRAENTQKGRYRELLQCDIDTVGASSPLADAEIIEVADKSLRMLGFRKYKIKVNDRKIFENIDLESIKILDKLEKIGPEKVEEELARINSKETLNKIENSKPLETTDAILKMLKNLGINENNYEFSPTLARGLDYYTGTIFEIKIEGYSGGSVGGGGRYDNLIGLFANRQIPAVGFAFGFDRLMEAMEEQNLFPANLNTTKVLVTVFSPELLDNSIRVCEILSQNNINQELYVDPNAKMEKQLKYADKKQIPYVVIIGPDEAKNNTVTVKNLKTREQKALPFDQFLDLFKE